MALSPTGKAPHWGLADPRLSQAGAGRQRAAIPEAGASALGAGIIATAAEIATTATATAAAAGTAGIEAVASAIATAIAAIFPAPGSGAALTAAAASSTAIAAGPGAITTTTAAIAARAATTAPAAAAIAAASSTAAAAGFGLVDAQGTTHQLNPLQGIDGLGLQLWIHHLDEGEAALATGVPLQGKGAVRHLSKGGEELENVFLLGAEGQITDKNTH